MAKQIEVRFDWVIDFLTMSNVRPDPDASMRCFYVKKSSNRDEAIVMAYDSGGYGMKEIGDHFELHYSRVSRIISSRSISKLGKAKDKT